MTRKVAFVAGGAGIVMTDVFVSATATLLIVLAVANSTPDVPLPVQADVLARCAPEGGVVLRLPGGEAGPVARVGDAMEVGAALSALGLPVRPFYAIALTPNGFGLKESCRRAASDIVRAWNDSLASPGAPSARRAVLAILPVAEAAGPEPAP